MARSLRIDSICRPAGPLYVDGALPISRAWLADRTFPRLVGLLGTPDLRPDEAVVITRCAAVHAVGMRVSIGVAFVDRQGVVVRVVDPLPRRGARMRGATTVIEATAGVLAGVTPGVRVHLPNVHLFPHRGPFTRG